MHGFISPCTFSFRGRRQSFVPSRMCFAGRGKVVQQHLERVELLFLPIYQQPKTARPGRRGFAEAPVLEPEAGPVQVSGLASSSSPVDGGGKRLLFQDCRAGWGMCGCLVAESGSVFLLKSMSWGAWGAAPVDVRLPMAPSRPLGRVSTATHLKAGGRWSSFSSWGCSAFSSTAAAGAGDLEHRFLKDLGTWL